MKFAVTKTSNPHYEELKEFNTLEELVNFLRELSHGKRFGVDLILSDSLFFPTLGEDEYEIGLEIYDSYRE